MTIHINLRVHTHTHKHERAQFIVQQSVDNYSTTLPRPFLIPPFSLPGMLCDPTDLIWRKGTPFEAMTGRTAPSNQSDI